MQQHLQYQKEEPGRARARLAAVMDSVKYFLYYGASGLLYAHPHHPLPLPLQCCGGWLVIPRPLPRPLLPHPSPSPSELLP